MGRPEIVTFLEWRGGVGPWAELRTEFSVRQIRAAVDAGHILRDSRGQYALPTAQEARRAARRLSGVAVGRSAAALWQYQLKVQPLKPEIAVPRGRKVPAAEQQRCAISWRTLDPAEIRTTDVTTPVRTVIDCARSPPFDEALAIADSALRRRHVTRAQLLSAAEAVKRNGRAAALRVATHADGRAAGPFESVVRAISLDVEGLHLEPQLAVRSGGRVIHPDLVDERLRIAVEADSYEFHTTRHQIDIDCERYTELALDGWLVIRVSYQQAMHRQDWVRCAFRRAVARRSHLAQR